MRPARTHVSPPRFGWPFASHPLLIRRWLGAIRTRTLLTWLGLSIGCAAMFSVQLLSVSIERALTASIRAAFGERFIAISNAGAGVDESLLGDVSDVPGVAVSPVVYASATMHAPFEGRLQIVGIDLVRSGLEGFASFGGLRMQVDPLVLVADSRSILVSRAFADSHHVAVGDELSALTPQGLQRLEIRGLIETPPSASASAAALAVMDVYAAQELFQRRQFDELLVWSTTVDLGRLVGPLRSVVGGRAQVLPAGSDRGGAEAMLQGLRIGLSLIGGVAGGLGICLVYAFASLAVLARARDLAVLRAIGMTRGGVRTIVLSEALLLALLAVLSGWVLGVVLARLLLPFAQAGMDGYVRDVRLGVSSLSWEQIGRMAGMACGAMICGAIVPARWATHVSVADGLTGRVETGAALVRPLRRRTRVALAVLGSIAAFVLGSTAMTESPTALLVGAPILVVLGSQVLVASFGFIARRAPALGCRVWGAEGAMAGMGLSSSPRRTVTALLTFTAVIAAIGATTVFLGSFRESIDRWFVATFPQDLTVLSGTSIKGVHVNPLPPLAGARIRELPDVAEVLSVRTRTIEYRGEEVYLMAQHLRAAARRGILVRPDTLDLPDSLMGVVLATPAFLRHFGKHVGDVVQLPTPGGTRDFTIAGQYLEFAGTTGALQIDAEEYEKHWGDSLVDMLEVFLADATNAERVRLAILRELGDQYDLRVMGREEFVSNSAERISRSFSFTAVLDFLFVLIGILGISVTVLTSLVERKRDLGVLRAIGALSEQLVRSARLEFVMLSGIAAVAGTIVGIVGGKFLTDVVVREGLGWYVPCRPPWLELAAVAVGTVVLSWIASAMPARSVSRVAVGDAIWRE
jgi:putative ABC transport system permease protein